VPKVRFLNELVTVEVPEQTSLRDVAMQQGVELYRGMWTHVNCRGNGLCGRCRIWILETDRKRPGASRRSLREHAHVRVVTGKMRLACQVRVVGDLDVRTRPIGPAVLQEVAPASYKAEAERRYAEALEAEHQAAELKKKAAEEAREKEPPTADAAKPKTQDPA
jgi:ferredoxin